MNYPKNIKDCKVISEGVVRYNLEIKLIPFRIRLKQWKCNLGFEFWRNLFRFPPKQASVLVAVMPGDPKYEDALYGMSLIMHEKHFKLK